MSASPVVAAKGADLRDRVHAGKFRVKTEGEQQIWIECSRLIFNAVIFYNTALLSRVHAQKLAAGDLEAAELVKKVSPVAWQHVNLFGSFVDVMVQLRTSAPKARSSISGFYTQNADQLEVRRPMTLAADAADGSREPAVLRHQAVAQQLDEGPPTTRRDDQQQKRDPLGEQKRYLNGEEHVRGQKRPRYLRLDRHPGPRLRAFAPASLPFANPSFRTPGGCANV